MFTRGILPPFGFHVPGGGIDSGESIIGALKRELYEELGIEEKDIISYTYLYTIDHKVYSIPHRSYIYLAVISDPTCSIPKKVSWEVPGYMWRTLTDQEHKKVFSGVLPITFSDILEDMKKNIGTLDRWIRAIIAIVLALVAFHNYQVDGLWQCLCSQSWSCIKQYLAGVFSINLSVKILVLYRMIKSYD